jgi:hypothetical protein
VQYQRAAESSRLRLVQLALKCSESRPRLSSYTSIALTPSRQGLPRQHVMHISRRESAKRGFISAQYRGRATTCMPDWKPAFACTQLGVVAIASRESTAVLPLITCHNPFIFVWSSVARCLCIHTRNAGGPSRAQNHLSHAQS